MQKKTGYGICVALLSISALDLTTSLIPSPADHLWPIPERTPLRMTLQWLLMIPLLIMIRRLPQRVWSAVARSGASLTARICMLAFVCIAAIHVSIRHESFPFSPVTMFSSGVSPRTSDGVETDGYLVVTKSGDLKPFRSLLEGGDWFARYNTDWDYKSGWVMHLFGFSFSMAREQIARTVIRSGDQYVHRTPYVYHRGTGEILSPKLAPKSKRDPK